MQKLGILILFLLCSVAILAQSEAKAHDLFQAADYPAAQKEYGLLLRRHPSSSLYLYRYARCAQEQGDYKTAIEYFKKSGNRYDLKHFNLGEIYLQLGYPERAIASYTAYLKTLRNGAERIPYVQAQIRQAEKMQRYMRRVEKVEIIDSVETSVDSILSFCPLSAEAGTITRDKKGRFVYTNQRKDRKLWDVATSDTTSVIVSSHDLMGQWSKPDTLPKDVNIANKQAYPYLLSDGLTLYFAANDTSGLGGYDIYITRYNTYTDSYTTPENLGMPFNSAANDYLMLIDESRNIGYFATDRFSPSGRVRIYSFVTNWQKTYWRDLPIDSLAAYAQLRYTLPAREENIKIESETIQPTKSTKETEETIFFVLNDSVVYTSPKDFKNTTALRKYHEWENIQRQSNYSNQQLSEMRLQYNEADEVERKKMAPTILQLEQLQSQYNVQSNKLIHQCRELESSTHQQ